MPRNFNTPQDMTNYLLSVGYDPSLQPWQRPQNVQFEMSDVSVQGQRVSPEAIAPQMPTPDPTAGQMTISPGLPAAPVRPTPTLPSPVPEFAPAQPQTPQGFGEPVPSEQIPQGISPLTAMGLIFEGEGDLTAAFPDPETTLNRVGGEGFVSSDIEDEIHDRGLALVLQDPKAKTLPTDPPEVKAEKDLYQLELGKFLVGYGLAQMQDAATEGVSAQERRGALLTTIGGIVSLAGGRIGGDWGWIGPVISMVGTIQHLSGVKETRRKIAKKRRGVRTNLAGSIQFLGQLGG